MQDGSPDRADVEVKTTFLERTVESLNEVVIDQGRALERLERRLARLEALAKTGAQAGDDLGDPLEERPPHY